MRHTNLILYNRYQKNDKGETTKVKKEKLTRAVCLYDVLTKPDVIKDKDGKVKETKPRFKDFDSFIIASDKLYCSENDKESNIPETFRIWRIVCPVLLLANIDVPEFLQ